MKNMIEREVKDDIKCLDQSYWKNGVATDKSGKTTERIGVWEKVLRLVLDMLSLSEEFRGEF